MPVPPRRNVRDLLVPRDATETARQGQGIGDIEAMKQMATKAVPEVLRMAPATSTGMSILDAAVAAANKDYKGAGMAALGAIPFAGALRYADEAADVVKGLQRGAEALPMDEASRMARAAEQGFTQEVFHGTRATQPFEQFVPRRGGQAHDLLGVHVGTQDAATDRLKKYYGVNSSWTKSKVEPKVGDAPSVMPLQMKMENPFLKKGGTPFTEAEIRSKVKAFAKKNGLKENSIDAKIAFERSLAEQGHDVIPYINTVEDRGSLSYLVLRPENLRSRYAKFDPANVGKAGLMGGLAALLAGRREEQE